MVRILSIGLRQYSAKGTLARQLARNLLWTIPDTRRVTAVTFYRRVSHTVGDSSIRREERHRLVVDHRRAPTVPVIFDWYVGSFSSFSLWLSSRYVEGNPSNQISRRLNS
jgi:hypothetical protein